MTLPRVSVMSVVPGLNELFRLILFPAHISMLPSVVVIAEAVLVASLMMFTSRPALNRTLPLVVVIAALTLTSCPQHATRLPLVTLTAALMFTSPAAFKVSVAEVVGVQVSAEATVMLPRPDAGTPAVPVLVVVIETSVPPPASNAVLRAAASMVAEPTPESGEKTFAVKVAPVVPVPMVTSAGSSSQVPRVPFGALASILIPPTSSQWPEVSISPPAPPCAPPRAAMLP